MSGGLWGGGADETRSVRVSEAGFYSLLPSAAALGVGESGATGVGGVGLDHGFQPIETSGHLVDSRSERQADPLVEA